MILKLKLKNEFVVMCIHSDRAGTLSHPWAQASTEIAQVLSCFVASICSAGCVHTALGGEWQAWRGWGVEGGGSQ